MMRSIIDKKLMYNAIYNFYVLQYFLKFLMHYDQIIKFFHLLIKCKD